MLEARAITLNRRRRRSPGGDGRRMRLKRNKGDSGAGTERSPCEIVKKGK